MLKEMQVFGAVGFMILLSLSSGAYAQAPDAESELQLLRLDSALSEIESDARLGRILGGSVLLGGAGVFGVLAINQAQQANSNAAGNAALYGVAGGLFAGIGLYVLLSPSNYETQPQKFHSMPDQTAEEKKIKLAWGESELTSLAAFAKNERIRRGTFDIILGSAGLVLHASSVITSSYNQVLLYEGIGLAGIGIVHLLLPSSVERKASAYHEWRADRPSVLSSLDWKLVPSARGVMGAVSLNF